MNLIQFNNVYKQYTGEYILKNVTFSINDGDKIGMIGLNGVGKSSIIKIILGQENHDGSIENINEKGSVFVNPNMKIGYLSQIHKFDSENNSVYEELLSVFSEQRNILHDIEKISLRMAIEENVDNLMEEYNSLNEKYEAMDGYNMEYKIKQVMQGLELNDFKESQIKSLSGGEKTRVTLAKLLLEEPDLLILDEPTNHLDILSIEWLEEYLKKYGKSFLLVSHDRIFLDSVCNKIYELERGKVEQYNGNFSDFVIQKELILKGEIKRFEKETEKIKKMEEYITRFKAGIKAKQARGRQKILDRLNRMDDPVFNPNRMKLKFDISSSSADRVLSVKNLSKSFDGKKVLNNISFDMYKGDKVGIIGKNGIGKSTLLKILMGIKNQDDGEFKFGERVKLGYYDQDHQNLFPENNILQEINTSLNYTEEYLRSKAASFLFVGDDVLKPVSKLSGGEKVRLSLLKLSEQKGNLLLLDEPTNHLDIYSIEVLEDALIDYEGSLLLVSHNRHFINSVCNKIYYLSEDGLEEFKGNFDEYKMKISEKELYNNKNKEESDYFKRKEEKKLESSRKKELEKIEKNIEEIGIRIEKLNLNMDEAGKKNDLGLMLEIQKELDDLKILEDELLEKWTNFSD
ncbi:ABC-F family ATP-binding cassette domain-containing protein [Pseudostreptobacillus sp.]